MTTGPTKNAHRQVGIAGRTLCAGAYPRWARRKKRGPGQPCGRPDPARLDQNWGSFASGPHHGVVATADSTGRGLRS